MKKLFKAGLALAAAAGLLALMLAGHGGTVRAADTAQEPQFMVYYRAWRDKTMAGVNTSLPDKNTIAMTDLPTGIDIVNVFSYVPAGQEKQAQLFFDTLKSTYVPQMHARGVKLVRALDYGTLLKITEKYGNDPTPAQFDAYAKDLLQDLSGQWGLDGLDIDMETKPTAAQVKISDGVVNALAKYIGPKSGNASTRFIYDTNGSNVDPFKNVKDAFNLLGYQQYGSDSKRTAKAVADYQNVGFPKNQFLAGLTFPEEQDENNRWYDTDPIYTNSHIYDIAKYVRENQLAGMFLYAVDRDGRNYKEDLNRIVPTSFAWTKAAIEEVKGISVTEAKAIANFYLAQNKSKWTADQVKTAQDTINKGTNIYDVNKAFLNDDYTLALSPTFDPLAVKNQMETTKPEYTDINEIIYVQTTKASQYAYTDQFREDGTLAGLTLGSAWRTARKAVTASGDTYYQVGANGWLKASDVTLTRVIDETGVVQVTNDQGAATVDHLTNGQKVQTLKNGTTWRYTARAGDYYLVADRQWVNTNDVTVTPAPASGIFKAGSKGAALYNGTGEKQSRSLAAKTEWRITGVKWISGHAYYQVAKDLYVQAPDGVIAYNVGKQAVQLYDNQGNTVKAVLGAHTSWRVTSTVSRQGHLYYQVATNRFVRIY
ncbi:SLAP domain-containing protein [Schleiferilactobacillus perolens]|nr:SLAP domain-containing protein [Schleiferilactobacillus perolens]